MAKKVLYTIMVFILMIYICGCNKNASSDLNISEEVDPTDYCNDAVLETPEEDTEEDLEGTIGPIHTDEYYDPSCWSKLTQLYFFSNGLAEISFRTGPGFIDMTGKKIIEPGLFKYVNEFSEGRAVFVDNNNKYGFINDKGEVIIAAQFDGVDDYYEGLASVMVKVGNEKKFGFIDYNSHMVIEAKYDHVTNFSHGLATVRDGDKRYYINKKGEIAIEIENALCSPFSEGLAEVCLTTPQGEKHGYINKTGEWKISPRFNNGDPFSDGMARVKLNEKIVYINCEGKVAIDNIEGVTFFSDFHDGLAVVKKKTEHSQDEENEYTYGYMNKKGEIVIDFKYKSADDFSEGLAYVRNHDGKYGFINTEGQYVIQPRFEEVLHFSEGLAAVYWIDDKGNDRLGYINKSGEVVIELDVDELK